MIKRIFILIIIASTVYGQNYSIGLKAGYSSPVGGLSKWFNPAFSYGVSAGMASENDWLVSAEITYNLFDDENLDRERKARVDLSLEHIGVGVLGKYPILSTSGFNGFFNIGGGLYYWKGIRSEIQPDPDYNPPIPFIEKRTLEEWNWGLKTGLSVEYKLTKSISIETVVLYRLIIGELWPTLQPGIELENVAGFQTLNYFLQINYFFE